MMLAITGGTGFVGAALIEAALAAGHEVRALTRRAQPPRDGVSWIAGALDRPESLADLVRGADAVIHVAGTVNAPDRAGFAAGNVAGTAAMIDAAGRAGVARFVHVSSLAARAPALSLYGATKAEAEALVMAAPLDWRIVRPPAVYGPGDLEMLDVYRLARHGLALLPPPGRVSLIAVADLARLLLALAADNGPPALYEADDGTPSGWSHRDYARAIGAALGRRVHSLSLPAALLMLAARADSAVRGTRAKLTPDRARYMAHPDWVIDPARRPPPELWTPQQPTPDGLAATARWYRAQGLL
ncbi:NAD(P)-dependent oxidoreductase [Sphingomonas sp.]|uniref:NAD-dependent epimerase/dehydratase family protein n=1 Tax=Sphingomonas sp. TaxID=28214 RepID=UPI001D346C6B|nr:NAD(P)H-binding protein [Sphingomonas sp.]MBX9797172.1 NAD(P)H-binding protein [Sphingomonas sp.]